MESSTPPPFINYGSRRQPETPEPFAKQYLLGLGIGSFISLILWFFGWDTLSSGPYASVGLFALFAVPATKLVVGIVMIIRQYRKGVGAGLITSIAVGAMIFFGTCLAHMKP